MADLEVIPQGDLTLQINSGAESVELQISAPPDLQILTIDDESAKIDLTIEPQQNYEITLSVGQGPAGPPGESIGGSVLSVNGKTDNVVLTAEDVGAEPFGSVLQHEQSENPHPQYATLAQVEAAATVKNLVEGVGIDIANSDGTFSISNSGVLSVSTSGQGLIANVSTGDVVLQNTDRGTVAVLSHTQESDPHPQYTTVQEASAAAPVQSVVGSTGIAVNSVAGVFSVSNTGVTSISSQGQGLVVSSSTGGVSIENTDRGTVAVGNHEALPDPHPQYLTNSEGNALYTPLAHVGSGGTQHALATTTVAGFMSATDKTKLDGIQPGAEVNQNAFGIITGNTGTANADEKTDSIAITGQNGITTSVSDTPDSLVISPSYGSPVGLTPDGVNSAGTANTFARSDHVHATPTDVAVSLDANVANSEGTSTSFARADHTHALATGAAIQIVAGATAGAGTSPNLARADHVHSVATATPVALGAANAEGTATTLARSDHVHVYPTAAQVGAASTSFSNIAVVGQPTVVADEATDTLTLVAGSNITITTNAATDSITISSTASGGGGSSATGDIAFISLGGY